VSQSEEAVRRLEERLPEVICVTPQEEQLLNSLVERVSQTQLQEKDPDAEALLNKQLGFNPDALYILAQTTLVQNIALEQAQAQLAQAKAQLAQAQQQPAHATSFLGGLLGHHDPAPVAAAVPVAAASPAYQPVYAPPAPQYVQPQYQQTQYVPVAGAQPSFLRGAMQTAAGVAAGALAFEGVEAVLHGIGGFGQPAYGWGGPGFGMGSGFGGGMMGGGFERPVEETVINNNYYDQPGGAGMERGEERNFSESSDEGGARLSDASYESSSDDQGSFDDSNSDNSGSDDDGGFDNSSSDSSGDSGDFS
jgi:hypothetical protein